MSPDQTALKAAIKAAKEAGDLLREEFHRPGGPRGTPHHAEVDEIAERLIRQQLLAAKPWSYLGEETGSGSGDPAYIWIVDPNDGTAAFMKGRRGSTVSIGALHHGIPILGVVYSYDYPDDNGDLIAWAEGCGPIIRNGHPVQCQLDDAKIEKYSVVILSQDADRNPIANTQCVFPGRFRSIPSIAYRLALAAVGEGVAAVSLNTPGSWDYAAGHALIRAAGGILIDQNGADVCYSHDGRSHTGHCFGGRASAAKELAIRSWDKVFELSQVSDSSIFGLFQPMPGQAIKDAQLLSKAQGCLLGQFIGDALGSQVEFMTSETIQQQFPGGVRELADGGTFSTIAGQPTDDSEMALMLARSLISEGKYDAGAVLEAYLHWYRSEPFDCGMTTATALRAAACGVNRKDRLNLVAQVASKQSQANGSLMRISPLAIFGWAGPDEAVAYARLESGNTHPNQICREACAVFVRAITSALSGADAQTCYRAALKEAKRGNETSVISTLEAAAISLPAGMDGHQAGWVLIALQNTFYQLLHARSFEEALVETISFGGDTDTNAAICGALLGAVFGRDQIPARWRQRILTCRPLAEAGTHHPRPIDFWPVDVYELAERLLMMGGEHQGFQN